MIFELYNETGLHYLFISMVAAFLVGASKTGLKGLGMTAIPIMAYFFGGKYSTGLILPILLTGDAFAVIFYKRDCQWKYIFKVLPWTLVGIIVGLVVGEHISDRTFKTIMAVLILSGMIILFIREQRKDKLKVPDYWWFSMLLGLAGGFSTMIGNAAGAVMTLYLVSMNLPKKSFIGTSAWFFFIVNLIKFPLHVFVWETISIKTLSYDLLVLPFIAIGAFTGYKIVKLIPEKGYRYFVIAITTISALLLFE